MNTHMQQVPTKEFQTSQRTQPPASSIFKKPPRTETHKPVSVSVETHQILTGMQLDMQYKLRRKVSFDEVIIALLAEQGRMPPPEESPNGST